MVRQSLEIHTSKKIQRNNLWCASPGLDWGVNFVKRINSQGDSMKNHLQLLDIQALLLELIIAFSPRYFPAAHDTSQLWNVKTVRNIVVLRLIINYPLYDITCYLSHSEYHHLSKDHYHYTAIHPLGCRSDLSS